MKLRCGSKITLLAFGFCFVGLDCLCRADAIFENVAVSADVLYPPDGAIFYVQNPGDYVTVTATGKSKISYTVTTDDNWLSVEHTYRITTSQGRIEGDQICLYPGDTTKSESVAIGPDVLTVTQDYGVGHYWVSVYHKAVNLTTDQIIGIVSSDVHEFEVKVMPATAGGFQGLGSPETNAYGVSADGSVVVGTVSGEAFRWTQDGGMVGLGGVSKARDVSADGSIVVGYSSSASGGEAFRWTQGGGMIGLGMPGGWLGSGANAVSADGSVVVGWGTLPGMPYPGGPDNTTQALRWENGTMTGLGFLLLPGEPMESMAFAVSADGSVVVGNGTGTYWGGDAFRWENGTMTNIGYLTLYDVSADGSVIVGKRSGEAIIWDAYHGVRNLQDVLVNDYRMNLQGFQGVQGLWEARGISDDGFTIVGTGRNPNNEPEAWIATLYMGMITDVRGNVTLDSLTAKMFDRIGRLSVLETGSDGYVRIKHPSWSEINIGKNSRMQVDGSPAKTNLDLIYGKLRARIKNHPGPCEVRMPQAVAGCRGTELVVQTTSDESQIIVLEGEVDVSTPNGSQTITLGQNQGIIATTKGLGDPFSVDPSQIDRWWEWGGAAENTPPGKNVVVSDPETGTTISFDTVEEGGETTVTLTSIGEGPPPPGGLELVPMGTYYDIYTTAEFSGTIHIELEYDDTNLTEGEKTALKLLQYDEGTGQWVDITTGLDTQNNIISGETDHLSFFALTVTDNLVPIADAGPDQTVEQESYEGTEVTLDGSGSTDPDSTPDTNNDIEFFDWYEGGTPLGSGETINYIFPLGEHTVTLVVTDFLGETDDDEVIIDVKRPLAPPVAIIKSSAIGELEGAKIGDKKIDKEVDKAIGHINKSLGIGEKHDPWEDDSHLDPKHGHKVFDEEKKAVKELMHLMDKKDTPEMVKQVCQVVIDYLIEADYMLADIAYSEALAGGDVDPHVARELEKCDQEFEKAQNELDHTKKDGTPDPRYDKAIDHYKRAWEHAQKALKKL